MYIIVLYIGIFFNYLPKQVSACDPGYYCPVDVNMTTSVINDRIAYYQFQPGNRFADSSGKLGSIISVNGDAYSTDGPWAMKESLLLQTSQTYNLPNMDLSSGVIGIAFWIKVNTDSTIGTLWSLSGSGGTVGYQIAYRTGQWVSFKNIATGYYNVLQAPNGVWTFMAMGARPPNVFYYPSGGVYFLSPFFSGFVSTSHTIGDGTINNVKIADFMLFKRTLTGAEYTTLSQYKFYPCPSGTFTDLPWQKSCIACSPGDYQPYPGQRACLKCSGATNEYYGSQTCISDASATACGIGPMPWYTPTVTPGTTQVTSGGQYMSMNCPSGTYNTAAGTMTRLTEGYAYATASSTCSGGNGGCVWMSSYYATTSDYYVSNAFDLAQGTFTHANSVVNGFMAIDFGTSTYVDSVLIVDRLGSISVCIREDTLRIFIGNTLIGPSRTSGGTGATTSYNIASTSNTLCFVGSTLDTGYRNPLWASCKGTGQYLYIVGSTSYLNIAEVVVLGQPPCTLCAAGTFSINNQANTVCTECPVGTYQTGSGMSTCTTCPSGTWQPNVGKSFCVSNIAAGNYLSNQNFPYVSNLYANYMVIPGMWTLDSIGNMESLFISSGTGATGGSCNCAACGCYQVTNGAITAFYSVGLNLNALSTSTGFSMCMWIKDSTSSSYHRIFNLTTASESGSIRMEQSNTYGNFYTATVNGGTSNTCANVNVNEVSFGTWFMYCITNSGSTWNIYQYTATQRVTTCTAATVNSALYTKLNFISANTITLGHFMFYNRVLSTTEINVVYAFRLSFPCPAGSFQPLANQETCTPCGIGTYQASTGATVCTACAGGNAPGYGSIVCSASGYRVAQPSSSITYTPGQAMLTTGANYISFNCPSGTYFTQVFNIVPTWINSVAFTSAYYSAGVLTSCSTGTCVWMSSQLDNTVSTGALYSVDGVWDTNKGSSAATANQYWAISHYSGGTHVHSVIIFEDSDATSLNNFQVYAGNSLYSQGSIMAPTISGIYQYPIAATANKLCYSETTAQPGYHLGIQYYCNTFARYLYIMSPNSAGFKIREVIVTSNSTCSTCGAGTYSYNTIPSVKCIQCPAGTYQSGTGMSFCDACHSGTFSTGVGMTTSDACVSLNTSMTAYYAFNQGQRLQDSSSFTGALTAGLTAQSVVFDTDGPWPGAQSFSNNIGTNYLTVPGTIASTAIWGAGVGYTICAWSKFQFAMTASAYADVFKLQTTSASYNTLRNKLGTNTFEMYWLSNNVETTGIKSNVPLSVNVWRHACIVYQSPNVLFYDNGVLQGTYAPSGGLYTGSYTLYVSSNSGYGILISQLRVYSRVLSAAEVLAVYNYRNFPCNDTAHCRPGYYCPLRLDSSCDNLIAYYGSWSDLPLLDGTGYTGSLTASGSGVTYSSTGGPTNILAHTILDGTSGYLQVPSINFGSLSAASGFSICTWYSITTLVNNIRIFDFGLGASNNNIIMYSSYNRITLNVSNGASLILNLPYTRSPVSTATWYHMCVTNLNTAYKLYENGLFITSGTASNTLVSTTLTSNLIGASNTNGDPKSAMKLTDFRIYNTQLTPAQVLDISNFQNILCPAGSYCIDGLTQPIPCPQSTYQANTGATACTPCPLGTYTKSPGANNVTQCISC